MKKIFNLIFVCVFMFILILVPTFIFITKDKEFSENENRYLSEKPRLSLDNIITGNYFKDFESYINDQFIFREDLYKIKTKIQIAVGNRDINKVYLSKDDYLVEKILDIDIDYKKMKENIEKINSFSENNKNIKLQLMIVPTASSILKDKLPRYAPTFNENKVLDIIKNNIKNITFIDLRKNLLIHKNEYIYYKTDHHWTTLGAFYGYQEWSKYNNINVNINDYSKEIVTTKFKGSLYSKILYDKVKDDKIVLFKDNNQINYEIFYNFDKIKSNNIYNIEKLKEKDKYQIFLGGNYPELKIYTNNKNNKNILIIKDSFANSFVPFLLKHYEKIYMIDMRYFKDSLIEYINLNHIDEILILCGITSFIK